MTPNEDATPMQESVPKPPPSIRRVLAGYLRVRSPFYLCVDAALVQLVAYVLQSLQRWLRIAEVRRGPVEQFSLNWAVNETFEIVVAMLYVTATGIFLVGCTRIIADRLAPPNR